jgi:hypothetical protein
MLLQRFLPPMVTVLPLRKPLPRIVTMLEKTRTRFMVLFATKTCLLAGS